MNNAEQIILDSINEINQSIFFLLYDLRRMEVKFLSGPQLKKLDIWFIFCMIRFSKPQRLILTRRRQPNVGWASDFFLAYDI